MSIGLAAGGRYWSVGTPEFLNAFFSTVRIRLEPDGWGSRFPVVMRDLYAGRLDPSSAPSATRELRGIRQDLTAHPPADVVWDAADRSRRPPWGDGISSDITSMADYFVTDDGEDLLAVLLEATAYCASVRESLRIG